MGRIGYRDGSQKDTGKLLGMLDMLIIILVMGSQKYVKTDQILHSKYVQFIVWSPYTSVNPLKTLKPSPAFPAFFHYSPPTLPRESLTQHQLPAAHCDSTGCFLSAARQGACASEVEALASLAQTQRLHGLPALFCSASGEMYGVLCEFLTRLKTGRYPGWQLPSPPCQRVGAAC